jgi:DNA repair exonuclease SbcCD ATPase subunit
VKETVRLILTKFTDETITVFSLLLLITMVGIIIYWFYNRKKFHQLSHEIPASVVKNYLDSIIQNSNSLKSSLFRGGGLDIGNGVPSVVPVGDLPASMSIGVGSGSEEIHQKNAEVAALTQKLRDHQKQILDLERTIQDLSAGKGLGAETELLKKDLAQSQQKVRDLEAQLAEAMARAGGDVNLQKELASVTSERNEIRERLKEYAIIEEDLANLKRLQQENDQLKAELLALKKGGAPVAAPVVAAAVAAPTPEPEEDDLEAAMAQAIADSKPASPAAAAPQVLDVAAEDIVEEEVEQKSAEELLSEFEKMLG